MKNEPRSIKFLPAGKPSPAVWRRLTIMAAGTLLCGSEALAVGFRNPNQDPEGIARGNAFVATADNPSAIYYNPAGITQLQGHQARAGIYAVSTGNDFTSPTGQSASPSSDFQPVPQLYYVYTPKELPLSFGLGVYAPFGLAVDWGENTPFRSVGTEGKLIYATVNPVIAWKAHETFSIAVGPQISYSQAELKQGMFIPGDQFKLKGDDIAYSFNAGILWKPIEQLSFGATYRYLTTMEYEGHATTTPHTPPAFLPPFIAPAYFGRSDLAASIRFPQSVTMGVSYRPTPKWNLEFNADWTDWDDVDSIVITGPPIPVPPIALNFQSSWMYEFGVTRNFDGGWFVSTGYIWSENSSPDAGFTPLIPDSDLHLGSVGFGRHGERWDWALAYHFGYNAGRTVTGSPRSLTGESADGTYKILNHAINAAVTFKF